MRQIKCQRDAQGTGHVSVTQCAVDRPFAQWTSATCWGVERRQWRRRGGPPAPATGQLQCSHWQTGRANRWQLSLHQPSLLSPKTVSLLLKYGSTVVECDQSALKACPDQFFLHHESCSPSPSLLSLLDTVNYSQQKPSFRLAASGFSRHPSATQLQLKSAHCHQVFSRDVSQNWL